MNLEEILHQRIHRPARTFYNSVLKTHVLKSGDVELSTVVKFGINDLHRHEGATILFNREAGWSLELGYLSVEEHLECVLLLAEVFGKLGYPSSVKAADVAREIGVFHLDLDLDESEEDQ